MAPTTYLALLLQTKSSSTPAESGAVEVNGWLLAGGAAAIVIAFVIYQSIVEARKKREREAAVERGPTVMPEGDFWDLVEKARRTAGDDMFQRPAELNELLRAQEPRDVAAFHERYQKLMESSDKPTMRSVAEAFIKNCTDSNYVAFRDWLISEGQDRFESIVASPDSLPAPVGKEIVVLEAFGYVAPRVYKAKAGRPISKAFEDEIKAATA